MMDVMGDFQVYDMIATNDECTIRLTMWKELGRLCLGISYLLFWPFNLGIVSESTTFHYYYIANENGLANTSAIFNVILILAFQMREIFRSCFVEILYYPSIYYKNTTMLLDWEDESAGRRSKRCPSWTK